MNLSYEEISKAIDYELLDPKLTVDELDQHLQSAIEFDVASVCIAPWALELGVKALRGTAVRAGTTISFPHGSNTKSIKLYEAIQALDTGAQELEAAVNTGLILSGKWDLIEEEIATLALLTHEAGQILKVTFESNSLNDSDKVRLCELCSAFKVDWITTANFNGEEADLADDIRLLQANAEHDLKVKSTGNISTLENLISGHALGATRFGISSLSLLKQARQDACPDKVVP